MNPLHRRARWLIPLAFPLAAAVALWAMTVGAIR
jgi:hypothetical protein